MKTLWMKHGVWLALFAAFSLMFAAPDADTHCDVRACPICGDGILGPGEQCDDGNDVNDDECANDCTVPACPTCPPEPVCGNGVLEAGEECDDGNSVDDDGCAGDCTLEPEPEADCGNGVVEAGEECDDGNDVNDDECANDCTLVDDECPGEPGVPDCDPEHKSLVCHVPPGNPENTHTICVDNHAVPAHLAHGDSAGDCEEECPGEPECGNGVIEDGEECDDGNKDNNDACRNNCQIKPGRGGLAGSSLLPASGGCSLIAP